MPWGFFSPLHIASLLFVAVFTVGLHYLLRRRSRKTQTTVLGVMSFLGIVSIVYHLLFKDCPYEHLPLHLCSFNAIVLPIVVFTKNKTWGNVLLVWCLGALAALILNNSICEDPFFSISTFFYYMPHVVEFAIPLLLVSLGHVEKDPKCIFSTVGITMGIYTVVHFINLGLNKWYQAADIRTPAGEIVKANFMYSLEPNNPLCELFQKWIPGPYWYMYLAVPILVVYLLILYAPELLRALKKKTA